MLAVVVASYLILRRITQSPFGMVLQSIRENEARTRAIGYPIERYKIVAVMLSGLFAGLAGVLYAIQNKFAAPDFVFFIVSGEVVIFNVIGGIGTLVGPIVGAAFFLLLREGLSRFFTEYYLISVGVIFVAMVIFMPQGLLASPGAGSTDRPTRPKPARDCFAPLAMTAKEVVIARSAATKQSRRCERHPVEPCATKGAVDGQGRGGPSSRQR